MSYEPLTQSEFVELLSDLIDEARDRVSRRSDAETVEDTELHTLQVTAGVLTHYRSHLRVKMANGQRWRVTIEEIP